MPGQAPIRAIFLDLDGTTLNKAHAISPFTARVLQTLKQLYQDRVALVFATGRPYHYVFEQMTAWNIHADYIISSNGCRIHRGSDRSLVAAHNLSPRTVQRLFHVNVERANGNLEPAAVSGDVSLVRTMSSNIFTGERWYTNHRIQNLGNSYPPHMQPVMLPREVLDALHITNPLAKAGPPPPAVANAEETLDAFLSEVHMFFFYGPHDQLVPVERVLLDESPLKDEVSFSFSLPHIIDVYPKGIDKSSAVREVLDLLGADAQDAIAMGDGLNDLTMIRAVGHGYVMANGAEKLKAAVPEAEVILSNAEDGVARKLVELFQLEVPCEL